MPKKKDDKKVVSITPNVEIPTSTYPTPEEIEEQMRRDEEEMDRRLARFIAANPMPPTSGVEEQEDEEEETFTLDFDKGIATQKIGEGVAVRDASGNMKMLNEQEMNELKEAIAPSANDVYIPEPRILPYEREKNRFQDMITERMVSKALSSLMERLSKAQTDAYTAASKAGLNFLGDRVANAAYDAIEQQKKDLRQAWHGGIVAYDRIPSWAMPWVEDYIRNGLNTLLDFVERD